MRFTEPISHKVRPLSDSQGFVEAFARTIQQSAGHVCEVCGLERMGHAPESEWLGYTEHPWQPVPADRAMLDRAQKLTHDAYRARATASVTR